MLTQQHDLGARSQPVSTRMSACMAITQVVRSSSPPIVTSKTFHTTGGNKAGSLLNLTAGIVRHMLLLQEVAHGGRFP